MAFSAADKTAVAKGFARIWTNQKGNPSNNTTTELETAAEKYDAALDDTGTTLGATTIRAHLKAALNTELVAPNANSKKALLANLCNARIAGDLTDEGRVLID